MDANQQPPMKDQNAIDLDDEMNKGLSPTGIKQLLDLIAQNSWWIPQEVYDKVKVVYPETRRMHSKEGRKRGSSGSLQKRKKRERETIFGPVL